VKEKNPKFLYISDCCQVQATKEPCERSNDERKSKEYGEATLGKWRCGQCHKPCKVRTRNPIGE
jgi:hypothetical protein